MVEYNASGLAGFYATLKNLSVAVLKSYAHMMRI